MIWGSNGICTYMNIEHLCTEAKSEFLIAVNIHICLVHRPGSKLSGFNVLVKVRQDLNWISSKSYFLEGISVRSTDCLFGFGFNDFLMFNIISLSCLMTKLLHFANNNFIWLVNVHCDGGLQYRLWCSLIRKYF